MLAKEKIIIISLGGSLIYTKDGIRIEFLRKFEKFIRDQVKSGKRIFIVTGGGFIARKYQKAIKEVIGKIPKEDVDWLGIHATRINGHLLRTIFSDIAHPRVIIQYENKEITKEAVTIAAGWKPGWSTDFDAVKLAEFYGAKLIINLSDIEVVYDKDPKLYPDASPIETTNWHYFRQLTGDKWEPGLSLPFDPIASKLAQELGLTVIITKGDDFANLEKIFSDKKFKGTVITSLRPDSAFFNKKYFNTNFFMRLRHVLRDLFRALKIKIFFRPESLLDVGCGTGRMIKYLRLLGVNAQGIEISDYLLSRVHRGSEKFIKRGSIMALPYENSSFEMVTTFDVLEHLPTEMIERAVNECNRVTAKLSLHKIFTTENLWIKWFHGIDSSHISVFSKDWWEKFWREKGFSKSKVFFLRLPLIMESLFVLEKRN